MRASRMCCLLLSLFVAGCGTEPGKGDDPPPPRPTPTDSTITVAGSKSTLAVNEVLALTASGRDSRGQPVELDDVTWSSSEPSVLRVERDGTVTGMGAGTATVTAASGNKSGNLTLTVRGAIHPHGSILTSETWREVDNPHIVLDDIVVAGPGTPVLTIEAGCNIRFEHGASIEIGYGSEGGALRVQGTAEKPVTFTTNADSPAPGQWQGVYFLEGATSSSISHAVVEYCGSNSGYGAANDACIIVSGSTVRPNFQDVTIQHSASQGITFMHEGAFGSNSRGLTVTDVANAPIYMGVNQLGSLPGDSVFMSNGRNVIRSPGGQVDRSQTWVNVGVPYAMEDSVYVDGATTPTLTLSPGVTLRFGRLSYFEIGTGEGGNLRAEGTAEAPITLTADAEFPMSGHWQGLVFGEMATAASKLTQAVVEYGGSHASDGNPNANVRVIVDKGPIITQTTLRHSMGCGITRAKTPNYDTFTTDFTAPSLGNVFSDNSGPAQCGP